jgi:polar amino acid transport system substrate-binding protein
LNKARLLEIDRLHYNEKVDKGAINFHALVQRVQKDRCNVFIARQDIFDGLLMLDTKLAELSESISSNKIPNIDQEKFYMLISRKFPNPYELKYVLDSGVQRLRDDGVYNKLLKKYTKHQ